MSIQQKSLFISMIISVFIILPQSTKSTVCPPRDIIIPCKCANYFNLIECTNITSDIDLKKIFINLKNELNRQHARPVYDELKLVQTQLTHIGSIDDIFSGISFRRISLSRNNRLKRIEPNAFDSSRNITTEIMIEDNELLGANHDDNVALFDTISRFVALNTLHLTDNGIRFIPKHAFNRSQPALRELFLTDNQIERIEDYAFTGLNTIQLINLDGNHLNKLSLHSLEIENTTQSLLRIFLRSNKIQTDALPPGIFTHLRRRIYLNMNINDLSRIPQNVFQSFFKRRSILSVAKNPLKCDCDFKWLLDQGIVYNSSNPDGDYLLRDYRCILDNDDRIIDEVNYNDFNHCPVSSMAQTLEQCLAQASDQEQELFCLNRCNVNDLYLGRTILVITFFICFQKLFFL
ncbi:slit protein-like protein 4 [Dermatophagoides farinae]|uniref:Slit protein-like protein 4 n=1 Tax=Dermatophagoides farinae TaxID=6954 RepID=A0A9D4P6Q2_DERFA|nr:slit protein-like protein 4 [Dermatophagoides farinae]